MERFGARLQSLDPHERRLIRTIMTQRRFITRRRALMLGAVSLMTLRSHRATAQVRLTIPRDGDFQPIPIAIPKFIGGTPGDTDTANGVTQVVAANLQRSGLFNVIDP